jgi:hypothetical protein
MKILHSFFQRGLAAFFLHSGCLNKQIKWNDKKYCSRISQLKYSVLEAKSRDTRTLHLLVSVELELEEPQRPRRACPGHSSVAHHEQPAWLLLTEARAAVQAVLDGEWRRGGLAYDHCKVESEKRCRDQSRSDRLVQ